MQIHLWTSIVLACAAARVVMAADPTGMASETEISALLVPEIELIGLRNEAAKHSVEDSFAPSFHLARPQNSNNNQVSSEGSKRQDSNQQIRDAGGAKDRIRAEADERVQHIAQSSAHTLSNALPVVERVDGHTTGPQKDFADLLHSIVDPAKGEARRAPEKSRVAPVPPDHAPVAKPFDWYARPWYASPASAKNKARVQPASQGATVQPVQPVYDAESSQPRAKHSSQNTDQLELKKKEEELEHGQKKVRDQEVKLAKAEATAVAKEVQLQKAEANAEEKAEHANKKAKEEVAKARALAKEQVAQEKKGLQEMIEEKKAADRKVKEMQKEVEAEKAEAASKAVDKVQKRGHEIARKMAAEQKNLVEAVEAQEKAKEEKAVKEMIEEKKAANRKVQEMQTEVEAEKAEKAEAVTEAVDKVEEQAEGHEHEVAGKMAAERKTEGNLVATVEAQEKKLDESNKNIGKLVEEKKELQKVIATEKVETEKEKEEVKKAMAKAQEQDDRKSKLIGRVQGVMGKSKKGHRQVQQEATKTKTMQETTSAHFWLEKPSLATAPVSAVETGSRVGRNSNSQIKPIPVESEAEDEAEQKRVDAAKDEAKIGQLEDDMPDETEPEMNQTGDAREAAATEDPTNHSEEGSHASDEKQVEKEINQAGQEGLGFSSSSSSSKQRTPAKNKFQQQLEDIGNKEIAASQPEIKVAAEAAKLARDAGLSPKAAKVAAKAAHKAFQEQEGKTLKEAAKEKEAKANDTAAKAEEEAAEKTVEEQTKAAKKEDKDVAADAALKAIQEHEGKNLKEAAEEKVEKANDTAAKEEKEAAKRTVEEQTKATKEEDKAAEEDEKGAKRVAEADEKAAKKVAEEAEEHGKKDVGKAAQEKGKKDVENTAEHQEEKTAEVEEEKGTSEPIVAHAGLQRLGIHKRSPALSSDKHASRAPPVVQSSADMKNALEKKVLKKKEDALKDKLEHLEEEHARLVKKLYAAEVAQRSILSESNEAEFVELGADSVKEITAELKKNEAEIEDAKNELEDVQEEERQDEQSIGDAFLCHDGYVACYVDTYASYLFLFFILLAATYFPYLYYKEQSGDQKHVKVTPFSDIFSVPLKPDHERTQTHWHYLVYTSVAACLILGANMVLATWDLYGYFFGVTDMAPGSTRQCMMDVTLCIMCSGILLCAWRAAWYQYLMPAPMLGWQLECALYAVIRAVVCFMVLVDVDVGVEFENKALAFSNSVLRMCMLCLMVLSGVMSLRYLRATPPISEEQAAKEDERLLLEKKRLQAEEDERKPVLFKSRPYTRGGRGAVGW